MQATYEITENIIWVGANDKKTPLFENLFPLPNGVSYNSYLIKDEKIALLDTVDAMVTEQFLENIEFELEGRAVDYLVIHHMEPDHGSNVKRLMEMFPKMVVVGTMKAKKMIKQFFTVEIEDRFLCVKEGDTLNLGTHTLTFYLAPMVHWPEVMVSYEEKTKILFSADAFGTFGTLDGCIFNDQVDFEKDYLADARRYYANIVGKYGLQTQMLLKKASKLDLKMIASLHGPIWRSNLEWYLEKYNKWSLYEPEEKGVLILCGSIYGHTLEAANALAVMMAKEGITNIKIQDVAKTDCSELIADIFKYSHLVIASATYNNGIFPKMADLLHDMIALNVQNRTIAVIQNGTWAPAAGKLIKAALCQMKNMNVLEEELTILSSLKQCQEEDLRKIAVAMKKALESEGGC
ncbi:MAG TPA: MBL fold metallo-hydrolase [Candidatus Dorea intestinavium]|nr:MBL fold metallo-hydrolase [Candidatus Dorea intestinavium]